METHIIKLHDPSTGMLNGEIIDTGIPEQVIKGIQTSFDNLDKGLCGSPIYYDPETNSVNFSVFTVKEGRQCTITISK